MLLVSCASEKTEEIDISALQLIPKKEKKLIPKVEEKVLLPVKNNLKPLLNKDQLTKKINIGKDNPFSSLGKEKNLTLKDIKLTGFLYFNNTNYALVNYMGKIGSIKNGDIGGINTDLLPDGTKIKDINFKNQKIVVVFNSESYEIFLE